MRPLLYRALIFAAFLAAGALPAAAEDTLFVIPVHDTIERALVYVIRRGMAQAADEGAKAVIFDMDTHGGRVDATEEILDILGASKIRTCTFVNPRAISAGAIIALGTDAIYMAPGSNIGDAMPIMLSPLGSPQELPSDIQEKSVSYVASLIRSTAERNGHDPKLAEAMVRRGVGYSIGGDVICPTNQLLTLTSREAERLVKVDGQERPLLSAGTVENLDALKERLGFPGARIVTFAVSPAERLARVIEALSFLLLAGGLIGLYIEFKTPGFGLPGILGLCLLAIWFWGHRVAGLAGSAELILFAVGVLLLAAEIFLFPGFGIAGIAGITMILVSLLMAMVQHYPGTPWYRPPIREIQDSILTLGASLLITAVAAVVLARFLPRTPLFRQLALDTAVSSARGYQASESTASLSGARGVAVTPLRPGGTAEIDGRRLSVVTRGDYLDAGTPIVVAETHGNRVVVERDAAKT